MLTLINYVPTGDPRQDFLEGAVALDVDYLDHRDSLDKARKIAFSEGIIATLNEHNLNMLVVPACTEMGVFAAFACMFLPTPPAYLSYHANLQQRRRLCRYRTPRKVQKRKTIRPVIRSALSRR